MERRIIISVVTWNSAHYVVALLESLARQTEQNCEVLITDNASRDDTLLLLSDFLPKLPFPATLFREKKNIGFSRAHNHHIREAIRRKARFIFIVNPDCILEEHAIASLVDAMQGNDRIGSVGGKIFRARFISNEKGSAAVQKLSCIDSTGIVMRRSREWSERGYGEEDHGQYHAGSIFGVSGACAFYRVRALVDTAMKRGGSREFFDEDFFSYKEDIDLAWRLQLFGWSAWYTPHAIAWHHRTFGKEQRDRVPYYLRALAWRNQFLLLIKNDDVRSILRDGYLIFFRECAKLFWIIFREQRTLALLPSFIRLWPLCMQKRQWIMQHRRRSYQEMRVLIQSFQSSSLRTKQKDS